jgi:hypothetical protein
LRVPYADFNGLKLPEGTEHEADFALLADIFPTGWHGLVLSGFKPGETVAVFGAGPVGRKQPPLVRWTNSRDGVDFSMMDNLLLLFRGDSLT